MNNIIQVNSLHKVYDKGLVPALKGIDLNLQEGKIYALMGSSGCGKSTLLNIIGTIDTPSKGEILYEGKTLLDIKNLNEFRRDYIGFIFQFHHLIPVLTLHENIESAMLSNPKISSTQRADRIKELLKKLNISHRANSFASDVSGGERQRAAIARALVNNPKLILADEPTGNVDSHTAKSILKTMHESVKKSDGTMLIATHDPDVAKIADVIIRMKDGKIISIN